ncbi:VWA domain-containing protein [bacterium]|nr:VWA domain-containing protein [bacterium]MBU1991229.1 VWA domain-containing protein [bacterium]
MSFLHPEFLYYMLPPLFILFALLLTQKEAQAHFFSEEVMRKLRVSANTLTLKARNGLFFLMGLLMIIALAQPVIKDGTVEVKAKSADIMMALDISDSMLAEDMYPNRLKLAKQKAIELLKIAPNERIGVIAFAKNSYLVSPLSFDHGAVRFLLEQLDTTSITEKGTDLLNMLEAVSNSLDKKSKKYLLILSDGGDENSFAKETAFAKEHDIVVFVLGIGTATGAPIKLKNGAFIKQKGDIIISKLNESISSLATSSGGVYIESTKSDDDIKTMLKEIESVGEQKELKSEKVQRYIPLFYYPLGLALFILLIATSSMSKRESVTLPSAFILFALLFTVPHAKAGVLDFMDLKEAKEAYTNQDYETSAKLYKAHADKSENPQSYYNAGNSFYKQKDYAEAVKSYEKARFTDKHASAQNLANLGNAYAKQNTPELLQKAIESYEASLKLEEDTQTRENLETLKKLLEEKKQDSEGEKDEKSQDSKEDEKQNDKKESGEKKDSQNNSEDEQNSKDEKNTDKKEQGSDGMKSDREKKQEEEKDASSENNETKNEKQKEDEPKKLEQSDSNNSDSSPEAQNASHFQMSDAEEKKWLQELNRQKRTYLYMLGEENHKEENENEKPW